MCTGLTLRFSRKNIGIFKLIKLVELAKMEVAKVGAVSLEKFPQNLSMDFRSLPLTVNVKLAPCL